MSKRDGRRPGLVKSRMSAVQFELLESRILCTAELRSFDGTGNNLLNPTWGADGATLLRLAAASYADGISTPVDRVSAREVSNEIAAAPTGDINSSTHLSAFAYLWGQFIDHDLDLTSSSSANGSLNIQVPTGDPEFDPLSTGTQVIPMGRSNYAAGTGVTTARQQYNDISAFLDGSMVYGSDATRDAALRTFSGGMLKTSDGGLLPFNTAGLANANDAHIFSDDQLFLAGDVRANENVELTSMQTLFVREHNRLAAQIGRQHPGWTDEQIFQQARRLVIGEIQNITYNEFLPALLGKNALGRYAGYNPKVNAGISNEFSTAAFRLGHSMLSNDVEFLNNDGSTSQPEMELSEVFFNPAVVEGSGIDPILKYLASSNSQEIDNYVVDGVRNFLFGPPGAGGLDLASLNIQRGRDNGLADYNTTRAALGLPKVTSCLQITSDPALAAKLQDVYGNVDNVDLWVGGLAEAHLAGSNVGATFQRILVDQFTRTRAGDRFWFERDLTGADLAKVRGATLADIIKANTSLTNLQNNVFVFDVQIGGQVVNGLPGSNRPGMPAMGLAGVTVQLLDQTGAVIDSVVTDPTGHYRFVGVQIGDYTIRLTLADGKQVTPKFDIHITRGGPVNDVNIAVPPPAHTAPPQPMHPSSPPSLQPVTMGLVNRTVLHLL